MWNPNNIQLISYFVTILSCYYLLIFLIIFPLLFPFNRISVSCDIIFLAPHPTLYLAYEQSPLLAQRYITNFV